jgi:F-type H+-transporting ATPase subunit b
MTIDWWTLALQVVNVVVLIWLLKRFFWRPLSAMIEQRRAAAQQMLADAEGKRSQAAAALADIERTRAGFASEREAILTAARDAAEQTRRAMLAAATQEAAALQAAARAAIDKQHDAAEQAWTERANLLAVAIAERLLARLEGPVINATFLDWLLGELRRLPENVRHGVAADGVVLQAVSATPIASSDQEHYRQLIGEAFGGRPQITFQVDPALIAGFELRGPHLVVANSWRADLNRILSDLAHGKRP